jgi:phosphoglycolate phosphatase-like HAD superfamily hydrolase|tara:strand:+ start:273 stop:938 length:666 start_codon:yes stop_codon:yes gene_type:complete
MLKTVDSIFFDFDGVITDSVNVKTVAFAKMYEPYGKEVVKSVVTHHLSNGGISRFQKFKIYHKEYLGIDLSNKQIQDLAGKFRNLVVQKVIDAPFVNGALEFLKKYYLDFPLFIISATPDVEINEIIDKKGLSKYFKKVYGSPTNKNEWARYILVNNNFDRTKVFFVGDALSDYNAAIDCGLHFVARIEKSANNPFKGIKLNYQINDLFDLEKQILKNANN